MKPSSLIRLRYARGSLLLLPLWAVSLSAQVAPSTGNSTDLPRPTVTSTFSQGITLLRKGQLPEAEAILTSGGLNRAGAASGYFESASTLLRAAMILRQEGNVATSMRVAQDALGLLAQAEQKLVLPADRSLAAAIKQTAGLIQERLVGSTETAKAYYQAAAEIDPKSPAVAKLGRLDQADAAAAARQAAKPTPRG